MTMTDPVADMLTRLRNANSAYHEDVSMPFSKLKSNIAEILKTEGYITDWSVEDAQVGKTLLLDLKFGPNRERSIAGLRRVSKPGLRVYAKSTNLPKVLSGLGIAILPTSSGRLTDRQAAKKGAGGEVLAYVWSGRREDHVTQWQEPDLRCQRRRGQGRRRGWRRQGTEGRAVRHHRRADHRIARRRCHHSEPSGRGARIAFAARTVPHAHQQYDRRCDRRLLEGPRDRRNRLPCPGQGIEPRVRPRLQPPDHRRTAGGDLLQRRRTDEGRRSRYRQAAGRRDRCEHPEAAPSRTRQGQGCALRRRNRPSQGRKGW